MNVRYRVLLRSGDFIDMQGNVLSRHKGVIRYTIGQRKGLGLALPKPMYVRAKNVDNKGRQNNMNKTNTSIITTGAILVAMAVVLSMFTVLKLPYGGSITAASMVPIIYFSFKYDLKWSMVTAMVYSGAQMLIGFYPPPVKDFISFLLVIMLDYVIAFGILGMAGYIGGMIKGSHLAKALTGTTVVITLRFICHFTSGIMIWSSYAPEGQPVWLYSLIYNGSYILGELIISLIAMAALLRTLPFDSKK